MPLFSLTVESTSNANTAGMIQTLMASGREMQLVATFLHLPTEASNRDFGRVVIDRISSIGTTNWDSLTPLELDPGGAASAITDATKSIEATSNGQAGTQVDVAIVDVPYGWFDWTPYNIVSGAAQGFMMRRATAPSGSRVLVATMIWKE